uniref:Reverse transcriptase domain-containing protein n=1 Tax=Paramormyrops kingsleyae TaxID=1676925 RepID=A0A3B3Q808_9TELE
FKESFCVYVRHEFPAFPSAVRKYNTDSKGLIIDNEIDMVNEFNDYFSRVFTIENTSNLPPINTNTASSMTNICITEVDVILSLAKLKINKSQGPDGILPIVLKEMRDIISQPLTLIFQKSLSAGVVPSDWKHANITPIFKKGDRSNPANYRPISLTSITGKIMEAIIQVKMVDYLDANNIIKDSQHGFRRGRSCLTNLLEFFEEATSEIDHKKAYDVIYLDFQKAFDVVPHKRLLLKLKAAGILGTVATWIKNWLTDRKQRVVIRGTMSQWASVHSGVPQGSILGPLLFLIYINDIDTNTYSKLVKFADDTKVGGVADTNLAAERLQRDLDLISEWADTWQMKFNTDKCKVIHNNRNHPDQFIHVILIYCPLFWHA